MYLYGQAAQPGAQSMLPSIIMMVAIFAIFYFIIIMPARKKQKQHQNMLSSLQGGERVITAGGIFGTISRVMDDRFEVEIDKNTRIQITKSSVAAVLDETGKEK